jgi:hypothetical protein
MAKKELIKEINALNKARKHYVKQSEWHRLMYSLTLKLEILKDIENG